MNIEKPQLLPFSFPFFPIDLCFFWWKGGGGVSLNVNFIKWRNNEIGKSFLQKKRRIFNEEIRKRYGSLGGCHSLKLLF